MKRKTQAEFEQEVAQKNGNIIVLGEYKGARKPLDFYCKKHLYRFTLKYASSILHTSYGCIECANDSYRPKRRTTNDLFMLKIGVTAPNVEPLEEYIKTTEKIKVRCKKCGNVWDAAPNSLLAGNECKKCAMKFVQNMRIKSHEQFISEIKTYNPNSDKFIVTSKYQKDSLPVECLCLECNRKWNVIAHQLIDKRGGTSCPYCNLSKAEGLIRNYLEKHNIQFEPQKTYDGLTGIGGGLLRYDFFIPSKNLLIEYQGEFHDGTPKHQTQDELDCQKEHDRRKREYAKSHGIELKEIWYKDRNYIETILDNILLT